MFWIQIRIQERKKDLGKKDFKVMKVQSFNLIIKNLDLEPDSPKRPVSGQDPVNMDPQHCLLVNNDWSFW
jgi:hypothetical protein